MKLPVRRRSLCSEENNLPVLRPNQIVATADHNVPTTNQHLPIKDELSRHQVSMLAQNCEDFGIDLYGLGHPNQGIVHVIGPEMGFTLPGSTIVCGDSHTSTHGAFGTVAFGIGTSQVGHVLATQCVLSYKPKRMRITVNGSLQKGVTAKDLILYIISKISASGATGYFVEYAGSAITSLSMEGRMTVCNMSIEMGARGGLVAPDQTTFDYLKGKPKAPQGDDWQKALEKWRQLPTDSHAVFEKEYTFDAADIAPMITYGTNPGLGAAVSSFVEEPSLLKQEEQPSYQKALDYMNLKAGQSLAGLPVDYVFIGSCTNARIEDLRAAATIVSGKKKADNVEVWVVPGSRQVEAQAISEGLDKVFAAAGIGFRQPGCSACLAMNEDKIPAGKYCVSTSNRNFEGRQGPGSRTFLASPLTAAAAAITGRITDVREII